MSFDAHWLGEAFQDQEQLAASYDGSGRLESLELRTAEKTIKVTLNPAQAVTVESMPEDLTLEEWLDGWRFQLIEAARPKVFQPTCSFCGKTDKEVHKIIAGPAVMICNECVSLCSEIIRESQA